MGFRTVAIARGRDEEPPAGKPGALYYTDSQAHDIVAELQTHDLHPLFNCYPIPNTKTGMLREIRML